MYHEEMDPLADHLNIHSPLIFIQGWQIIWNWFSKETLHWAWSTNVWVFSVYSPYHWI